MDEESRDALEVLRDGDVPPWLRNAAAIGWRLLVVGAVVLASAVAVVKLRVVVVPLLLALLLAAILAPPAGWLKDRGWPPLLATWAVVLVAIGVLTGIGWLVVPRFVDGLAEVGDSLVDAYEDIKTWVIEGPLAVDPAAVADAEDALVDRLQRIAEAGVTSQAALVVEIITAAFLTLIVTFFYIKDGDTFTETFVDRFPEPVQPRLREALAEGWHVLQRYVAGVFVVGLADAALIGIGIAIVGVPLVLPIMVLTFLAAFFPLVGAIFAGGIATLLALASGGLGDAIIVLLITIVVQQLDGDVIAPLVYSRAVDLHPLAILLAITAGGVLAGLLGALLAVPVLAVTLAMRRSWLTFTTEGVEP
ncbi:MAG: AI-2E family transporter [Acidimicrobiia bacterium]|nr:AI-2E family transporter [Acidimicrobiia bacterium]